MKYLIRTIPFNTIFLGLLILCSFSKIIAAPDCSYCLEDLDVCIQGCSGNPTCIENCGDTYEQCAFNCENNVPIEDNLFLLFLGGIFIIALSIGKNQMVKVFTGKMYIRRS